MRSQFKAGTIDKGQRTYTARMHERNRPRAVREQEELGTRRAHDGEAERNDMVEALR